MLFSDSASCCQPLRGLAAQDGDRSVKDTEAIASWRFSGLVRQAVWISSAESFTHVGRAGPLSTGFSRYGCGRWSWFRDVDSVHFILGAACFIAQTYQSGFCVKKRVGNLAELLKSQSELYNEFLVNFHKS